MKPRETSNNMYVNECRSGYRSYSKRIKMLHPSKVKVGRRSLEKAPPFDPFGPGAHKRCPTKAHFRDHVRSLWTRPELPVDSSGSTHVELSSTARRGSGIPIETIQNGRMCWGDQKQISYVRGKLLQFGLLGSPAILFELHLNLKSQPTYIHILRLANIWNFNRAVTNIWCEKSRSSTAMN